MSTTIWKTVMTEEQAAHAARLRLLSEIWASVHIEAPASTDQPPQFNVISPDDQPPVSNLCPMHPKGRCGQPCLPHGDHLTGRYEETLDRSPIFDMPSGKHQIAAWEEDDPHPPCSMWWQAIRRWIVVIKIIGPAA